MTPLEQLLAVQEHDTRTDQLRHRRANLPERAQLAGVERTRAAAESELVAMDERRNVLVREQKRLEDDIASTEERITAADRALYSGTVAAPRELQALQDEISSLKRRVTKLEDDELEVMEQLEPVEADYARLSAAVFEADADAERLRAAVTANEAEIDVELDRAAAARAEAAAGVADDLLAEYERLRGRAQGVAVARLVAGVCGGCHIRLPAVELDRIKKQPVDDLVRCEECGRLLVR